MNPLKLLQNITFLVVIAATVSWNSNTQPQTTVQAYPGFRPCKFHLVVMNTLPGDNAMNVHCHGDGDLGEEKTLVNTNYTRPFWTAIYYTTKYKCDVNWSLGQLTFESFRDEPDWVDLNCGGPHCIWKANNNGVSLYHIQKQVFVFKQKWNTTRL
ncbi:hypothetical protein RND81_05G220600 [Saponaria officinalis]|uniref:S-protein homolog n=1 Tax=Saponaria officinalis TaxID=3572 RepID=A0AAW1L0S1_SAPOF